ncbi:TBC1 domain family member 22A [Galemys pyrenaicus]|uniref:TBC1 domain family member 22A n=1 Tax=Galemys pyrenaicus TaxID=202257 RepID=A0A8J6DRD0_GALPY|nr:TBC1 domain family member 22A [Galemys pyrenaicus]
MCALVCGAHCPAAGRGSAPGESANACLFLLATEELRKLSWSGIPKPVRPMTWKLLSGYLPANAERRPATLQRKQKEYFAFVERYYDSRNDEAHQDTYRQIHIDIPRMSPEALILQPKVTEIFERILFIWAIRHPASGYVQGINDLVTPFFVVFICEHVEVDDVDAADISRVPPDVLCNVEADTFWCMSRLLDGIQDNYTFAQPGIQMKVKMLEELVSRIDEPVHRHLDQHEVRYLQFAFRWMNNLLMREVPLRCTVRLWDTYQVSPPCPAPPRPRAAPCARGRLPAERPRLCPSARSLPRAAEPEGFSRFHLYVCAAFLLRWRKDILEERDFQVRAQPDAPRRGVCQGLACGELLLFLQNLPTAHWDDEDVSLLLAEAYRLKFAFADAPNHYKK